jgi:Tfp pilus assembly protein PilN
MSQQQINLYPGIARASRTFPAFSHVALSLLLLLLVGFIAWGGMQLSLDRLRQEVTGQERQAELQQQELQRLQQDLQRPPDVHLQQLLEKARNDLARGEEVRRQLSQLAGTDQKGFAPQMEALARQTLAGLWLEKILLLDGGGVRLAGRSQNADRVPLYLQGLSRHEVFRGTEFSEVQLRHDKEAGSYLFQVDNTGEENP